MNDGNGGQKGIGKQRLSEMCKLVCSAHLLLPDENLSIVCSLLSTGDLRVLPRAVQALDRFLASF